MGRVRCATIGATGGSLAAVEQANGEVRSSGK